MTSLTAFPLFGSLPRELRNRIWKLTLPSPRIILVCPSCPKPSSDPLTPATYTASPSSFGACLPVILSVNRESRAEAFLHLTHRFNCYWNLKIDSLYIECRPELRLDVSMEQLYNMRLRGLLDGVKHLALDWKLWSEERLEHCSVSLKYLAELETCSFINRLPISVPVASLRAKDIIDPGEMWEMVPTAEYKTKEILNIVKKKMDVKVTGAQEDLWQIECSTKGNAQGLVVNVKEITNRKAVDIAVEEERIEMQWRSQDWFG